MKPGVSDLGYIHVSGVPGMSNDSYGGNQSWFEDEIVSDEIYLNIKKQDVE